MFDGPLEIKRFTNHVLSMTRSSSGQERNTNGNIFKCGIWIVMYLLVLEIWSNYNNK